MGFTLFNLHPKYIHYFSKTTRFFSFYIPFHMKKIVFVLLFLALLAFGAFQLGKQSLFGPSEVSVRTLFQVDAGASVAKVAKNLEEQGLVSHSKLFYWWCRYRKAALKAGWYDIPPRTSIASLAEILTSGKTATRKVTIPEGRASWEMPAYFRKVLPDFDSCAWESLVHDPKFAKELGVQAGSLEGYLLPDTYPVEINASEKDVARQMVRANQKLEAEMKSLNSPFWNILGGWHGVLTLASVVEEETGKTDERNLIAGVFHNRLRMGIPLGADPTVRFIFRNLTGPIYKSQLQSDNPYNTRRFPGLMPGPISNPGRKAIRAALEPATTNALYFVAKDDGSGTHFFSNTLADHNKFKNKAAKNRGE